MIAAHVRQHWSAQEVEELRGRLEHQCELKARHPSDGDLWGYSQAKVPCAFLGPTGLCRIYEVRPMACRAHHSLDAGRCEAALSSTYTTFPQVEMLNKIFAALSVAHLRQISPSSGGHGAAARFSSGPIAAATAGLPIIISSPWARRMFCGSATNCWTVAR